MFSWFINVVNGYFVVRVIRKAVTFLVVLLRIIIALSRQGVGLYWIECGKIFIVPICILRIRNSTSIFVLNFASYNSFYVCRYLRLISVCECNNYMLNSSSYNQHNFVWFFVVELNRYLPVVFYNIQRCTISRFEVLKIKKKKYTKNKLSNLPCLRRI